MVRAPLFSINAYLSLASAARGARSRRRCPIARQPPRSVRPTSRQPMGAPCIGRGSACLVEALARKGVAPRKATAVHGKLLTFLIRMSTRPTPYGLFAGVDAGSGPKSELTSSGRRQALELYEFHGAKVADCDVEIEAAPRDLND